VIVYMEEEGSARWPTLRRHRLGGLAHPVRDRHGFRLGMEVREEERWLD
jgi:hypothetical protein